ALRCVSPALRGPAARPMLAVAAARHRCHHDRPWGFTIGAMGKHAEFFFSAHSCLAALALLSTAMPAHPEPSSEPEVLSSIPSRGPEVLAESSEQASDARGFTAAHPYVSAE